MVAIKMVEARQVGCTVDGTFLEECDTFQAFRTAKDAWRYVREAYRSEYRRVILVEWYDLPGGRQRVFEVDTLNQPAMQPSRCYCDACY